MRNKIIVILAIGLFLSVGGVRSAFALVHIPKNGLFSIDIPEGWRWFEEPQEIVITYPDGKTVAIDIQMVPGSKLPLADIKKNMKESNDKIIKTGIEAHQGTLINNKEISFDGAYATQLDFATAPPDPVFVTYISVYKKGYALSLRYGSSDEKMRFMMEDVVSSFKFR